MTKSGRDIVRALKSGVEPYGSSFQIPIAGFDGLFMRPIRTEQALQNHDDVRCLTEWRNRHVRAFLTEFVATNERTARWLGQSVHRDDSRFLFMIVNADQERMGYMGMAYIDWEKAYGEADAIVSSGNSPKGMMSSALRTVLNWSKTTLGLKTIAVRVLSDNSALAFYQKLGFREDKRVPLRAVASGGELSWVEDDSLTSSDRYLVHHFWNGNEH